MKRLSILFFTIILLSCSKEEITSTISTNQPQFSVTDPVIEAYSPFGDVELAPDNYVPEFSSCSNYLAVYLHYPNNGPWSGKTVEIYRFEDEADMDAPCGDEFDLTKVTGTNENGEYNYCESPAKDCYEGTVNGHCALVFCDK